MTFHELDQQILKTNQIISEGWVFEHSLSYEKMVREQILKNQLIIMKTLNHIDNDLRSISR